MDYDYPYNGLARLARPCPSCGHCPTCGRGATWPTYPMYPYWNGITYTSGPLQASSTITTTGYHTTT